MFGLDDILIVSTAIVIGCCCSLLGCFLVLRKSVMIGDAISHSVLPGIVLAFLYTESKASLPILIGAAIFGVLSTVVIDIFQRRTSLQKDASIGISFTFFFALGIIMIAYFTGGDADIDQECVLFGEIGTTFLDKVIWNDYLIGTSDMVTMLPVLALIIIFFIFGWKGLLLTTFNEDYAKALGIRVNMWHYLLMLLVSITSVLAFESVGAILVVGFLVIPPATAYLLTNRIKKMFVLSIFLTITACILGYLFALQFDLTISGSIVVLTGFQFILIWLITSVKKNFSNKTSANSSTASLEK